jgi:excisionase family DNA binding protein
VATDVLRISIAEAARRLDVSVKTLKRRAAAGRIQLVKDGGRLYVPESSLRAYADEKQAAAEGAAGWQALADLRVLFPIPELDARRRAAQAAREAAGRPTDPNEETKR